MLVSQCAVSISWGLSGAYLSDIENTDLTNKTTENNESNETSQTDKEDDTEEKEFIIHHPINAKSKLESKSDPNSIHKWLQSLSLDVKGIPPDLT